MKKFNRTGKQLSIAVLGILTLCTTSVLAQSKVMAASGGWMKPPTEEQVAACDVFMAGFIFPDGTQGDVKTYYTQSHIDSVVAMGQRNGTKILTAFGGGNMPITEELMGVPEHRHALISNIMDHIEQNNLDGLDNDWEPAFIFDDEEKMFNINLVMNNYYLVFTRELRDSLDSRFGEGVKSLSASIFPTNKIEYANPVYDNDPRSAHFPEGFAEYLDFVTLMCYDDGVGRDHATTSSIFKAGGHIDHWVEQGISKEKLNIGLSGYGRAAWNGTNPVVPYNTIIEAVPDIDSTVDVVRYDFGDGAKLYGFNSQGNVLEKQQLVDEEGLYGVMLVLLEYDVPIDHPRSLLAVLSDYTPVEKSVKITTPIERAVVSPGMETRIILSNHFSCSDGAITYSVNADQTEHTVEIAGDTLIITGAATSESSITALSVRAASSGDKSDYITHGFTLITDPRETVTSTQSENHVLSDEWYLFRSHDQFALPENDADLRTRTESGDTVISMTGAIFDTSFWNWTLLGIEMSENVDLTKDQIILEYRSTIEVNNDHMTAMFYDTSGGYHSYRLKAKQGEWVRDTITWEKLRVGYLQPETIDYSEIDSVFFNIGGAGIDMHWSFQLKEYRYEPRSGSSSIASAVQKQGLCQIQSLSNGVLNLNHRFSSEHQLTITDLRGRELFRKAVTPGTGSTAIALPVARGIYLAQISGAQFNQSWKLKLQ